MKKVIFYVCGILLVSGILYSRAESASEKEQQKRLRMEEIARNLPDSLFENVKAEDLLDDEVYLKLASDGWTPQEILTIMETAVKDKKKAKEKFGYGYYAKQWRPTYGRGIGNDPLYQSSDSGMGTKTLASIYAAVGEPDYNATWDVVPYDPSDRKKPNYQRNKGYFRQVMFNPSSGRTHWIVANQDDPSGNQIYAIPDNAGIFSSKDGGKTWTCITDNIPERANRSQSPGYSLPVDPDKWDHLFAFMANNSVYETVDGGTTWRRIAGATHKSFKRGYCFRDAQGTLRFIGAQQSGNNGILWVSQDTCKTWTQVTLPEEFKEPGTNGFWFQQILFPAKHTDKIYFPGSRSILYMDDGARGREENGKRVYTLKRLPLNITGHSDSITRNLTNQNYFPLAATSPGFMEINPWNNKMMWFAAGIRETNETALYFTKDGGENWETLHEPSVKIGSGHLYGNEAPWNWLGGFGVEYKADDPDYVPQNLFACTMSSAYSNDGGKNWTEYAWGTRQRSLIETGLTNPSGASNPSGYYYVSASRHNADNHCIFSHKSGKVFRGGDGGFFVHDPDKSGHITDIGTHDWINISSNLGQMLFYNVRTNEFGDQAIIGNTQDIDVQTYRYGRWGHWRGYEGTESSFNPYTSTGYFSGGGGDGPEGMEPNSWHTARNYADVVTGSWFMLRTWNGGGHQSTLFRVDDIGKSLTDLYPSIGKKVTDVALARDQGRLTVFIKTDDNVIHMSVDSCKTFNTLMTANGIQAKFSDTRIAADPDNSNVLYLGQKNGQVWKYLVKEGTYTPVGTGLPTNITCSRLFFHEGSGDLYYADTNSGIYLLKNGESKWRFWTRGYNNSKFNDIDINYTTQEMVISDYGRGVWVADLETPSDRYFKNGFELEEKSHKNGRRVFGIKTCWTIPMYYNYKWLIDGTEVPNSNYQYLNVSDKTNIDKVQLVLTLRESPDVSTTSAELKVNDSQNAELERHQGNALYSNGQGRVDIGYMDWFDGSFSVDLWVKPEGDGVIMSNTQKSVEKGAKGWLLYIENGVLKFKYYPSNVISQPTYEVSMIQNAVVSGSAITMNKWSHVAVTQERKGNIVLYINGQQVGSSERIRKDEEHGLNNSVIMSLFADAFESNCLRGAVDELKVWNRALTSTEVQREMFSTALNTDGLMAYYNFNGDKLEDNKEIFAGHTPSSRTRAVTEAVRQTTPVSADYVASANVSGSTEFKGQDGTPLMTINSSNLSGANTVVYGYDAERWSNPDDNLSEDYYEPTPYGYLIRTFGTYNPDGTADITFANGNIGFDNLRNYRLYTADNSEDRMYWKQFPGKVEHDGNKLKISGVKLSDVVDRKLMLVTMKPAIEMQIEGLSNDGRVVLYDDGQDRTQFNFTARLIENKTLKTNSYEIMSDSTVLIVPETPLSFDDKGEAKGQIYVDATKIGDFNNVISTYIRGKNDNDMIPIPVDILNRISPRTLGNGVKITKGGLKFGTPADFEALTGSKSYTIMGWVRFDDEEMLIKGRNNDGVSPLLFFRTAPSNAGTTGINLKRFNNEDFARLGYHINDVSTTYNAQSEFKIYKSDVGKWFHVALVVSPTEVWLYFNGEKQKMVAPNPIPACTAQSPMLVGMNVQGGNTYFSGAFDHIAMWSRSLSDEEVRKYMHNRVLLNDPGLMAYITMDELTDDGKFKESVNGFTAVKYGTVTSEVATPVPFAPFHTYTPANSTGSPIVLPQTSNITVASFEGKPYNYIPADTPEQQYLPLNNEFYTVVFDTKPTATADLDMTYNYQGLINDEVIAAGIRSVGSTTPFSNYITASSVNGGKATFKIPATRLAESSEVMFFSAPTSAHRPTIVNMGFRNPAIVSGGTYLLADGENTIDVDINVVSGNDVVNIVPKESYVTVNQSQVNMDDPSQTVILSINKDELRKTNPFGLSDVTLNLEGTTTEPLTLKVGLKPRVELSLKNGTDPSNYVAKEAISTMDIDVKLIEGYLDREVPLKVTPDNITSAFNINNGSLLLNEPVTIDGLKKVDSSDEGISAGWNLVGNPYLTEINLTKPQNYDYAEKAMTHYVYHTLDGSDNIIAFDMTEYTDEQHIVPFQSYYVQTLMDDAALTVTQVAKERTLSRKTFDYYSASETRGVTLRLLDENDNEIDRTTVRWENDATGDYFVDEDAAKIHSLNELSNELYTVADNGVETSINIQPDGESNKTVPVVVNLRSPGNLRLEVTRLSGFSEDEMEEGDRVYLTDKSPDGGNVTDPIQLKNGLKYELNDEVGPVNLYIYPLYLKDIPTGAEGVGDGNRPDYRVYTGHSSLTVTGLQGDATVNVYSTGGVLMFRQHTDQPELSTTIEPGIYIVRIHENKKEFATKVLVN